MSLPWGYIWSGAVLAFLGAVLFGITGFTFDGPGGLVIGLFGIGCAVIGGLFLQIGVIAQGVRIGSSA